MKTISRKISHWNIAKYDSALCCFALVKYSERFQMDFLLCISFQIVLLGNASTVLLLTISKEALHTDRSHNIAGLPVS